MLGSLIEAGASLIGGMMSRDAQAEQGEQNRALQREFAQSGVQWKVADAKKAGVHPLYALGAPTVSPAVSIAADPMGPAVARAGSAIGKALDGQDITRARMATMAASERQAAFDQTVQEMTLQRMTLQNDLLQSQIQRLKAQKNPPFPETGPVQLGQGKTPDRQPIVIGGHVVRTDRGTSDTNDVTNRYGEGIGDWIYGPYVAWKDYSHHTWGPQPRAHDVYGPKPLNRR